MNTDLSHNASSAGAHAPAVNSQTYTDIIVAVHGIGMQRRSETVRSVATRLAGTKTLLEHGAGHPVAPQPLGYFCSDLKSLAAIRLVDDADVLKKTQLESIGFAEVFWSDIPQQVITEGRTLEETKAWARTVVARANALCLRAQKTRTSIVPPDFSLAGEVLDEMIDTIHVLENLLFLADKAGLFKFDLANVLQEYLGDVQLVTEFGYHRTEVVSRFHQAMESIYDQQIKLSPNLRIHIVAHSEGTVVSLLGMLHAISKQRVVPSDARTQTDARIESTGEFPKWLNHVAGYMTIGSPIDKHLLLWPRIWNGFKPDLANDLFRNGRIRWRNYYDYGDPVGFKLETARQWLEKVNCQAFEFCGCPECHNDMGFARYLFPGEAHNEYWNDPAVFDHFVNDVIRPKNPAPKPPASRWYGIFLGPTLPYLVSLLLLAGGVGVLFKAMEHYTHPGFDPLQKFVRYQGLGVTISHELSVWQSAGAVAGITALIAGATVLGRLPRLARGARWLLIGLCALAAGGLIYAELTPLPLQREIGRPFDYLGHHGSTWGIFALALIGGLCGYLAVPKLKMVGNAERRQRWFLKGTRPLMIYGAVVILAVVLLQLWLPNPWPILKTEELTGTSLTPVQTKLIMKARLAPDEVAEMIRARGADWQKTLETVLPVLAVNPPLWPLLFAGTAFFYLWWLSILVLDLSFVWHCYIRHSLTNRRLLEWNPYDFAPEEQGKKERCRKSKRVVGEVGI